MSGRRLWMKLIVHTAEQSDTVTHEDWYEIVATLSENEADRLRDIALLYRAVCGLERGRFRDEYVEEACYDLDRPIPLDGRLPPDWQLAECVALMTSRTLLPAKTCECFIDSETMAMVEWARAWLSANPMRPRSG